MNYTWRGLFISFFSVLTLFFGSCINSKKVLYFNNIQDTVLQNAGVNVESVIQKSDILSISVSSLNPEASAIFNSSAMMTPVSSNLISVAGVLPSGGGSNSTTSPQAMGYLVSQDGLINFPVLGTIHAEGLTKRQLEQELLKQLVDKKLLVQPIVTVRFLNFRVTVLGEVQRPATINVVNERISILEALGFAGDLTIYGKRENVLLIREENSKKVIRRLNLNSETLLSSPYYYLKTNDILYVEPNNAKIASTNRTQQLLPIILSALSFVAIIVTYGFRNN
jgi:polysaccharide export outer membrane protein